MRNIQHFYENAKEKHGSKFDKSCLNPDFIKYYESQERIKVDFGYEQLTGTIGVTTGWCPVFLLMRKSNSIGSCYTINNNDKVIAVRKNNKYIPV